MISARKYRMVQRILLLGGLFLALFYFFVFMPLGERVNALDRPLADRWNRLFKYHLVNGSVEGVDLASLNEQLEELQRTSQELVQFARQVKGRVGLEPGVQDKMRQPFQLVDFQNERQLRLEELERVAREKKVSLEPAVLAGYPEYSTDLRQPALLWGHLSIVHQALLTALHCQVTAVHLVTARAPRRLPSDESQPKIMDELPFIVHLTGTMPAVSRFLAALPVKSGDVQGAGFPEVPAGKPALFIDRLLMRKESPEKLDVVRVELRIVGLACPDQP